MKFLWEYFSKRLLRYSNYRTCREILHSAAPRAILLYSCNNYRYTTCAVSFLLNKSHKILFEITPQKRGKKIFKERSQEQGGIKSKRVFHFWTMRKAWPQSYLPTNCSHSALNKDIWQDLEEKRWSSSWTKTISLTTTHSMIGSLVPKLGRFIAALGSYRSKTLKTVNFGQKMAKFSS